MIGNIGRCSRSLRHLGRSAVAVGRHSLTATFAFLHSMPSLIRCTKREDSSYAHIDAMLVDLSAQCQRKHPLRKVTVALLCVGSTRTVA